MRDTTGHAKKKGREGTISFQCSGKDGQLPALTVATCHPDLFCRHFTKAGRGKRAALCVCYTKQRGNQSSKRQLCFAG